MKNKLPLSMLESLPLLEELHRDRILSERYSTESQIIKSALNNLQKYLNTLERLIQEGEETAVAELEQKYPPDAHEEFWAYFYPDHWQAVFVRYFRSSFVTTGIALGEHYLKQLCLDCQFIGQKEQNFVSVKGSSTVAKIRSYLMKEIGFQQPEEKVWQKLQDLYVIRNALVHAFDDVYSVQNSENLEQIIKKYPSIKIKMMYRDDNFSWGDTSHFIIDIKPEFCVLLVDTVSECLNTLCGEMSRFCEQLYQIDDKASVG